MSRRSLAAVVTALLAALLVSGCVDRGRSLDDIESSGSGGGSGPAGRPFEIVQASYDRLAAAGTARVRSASRTEVGAIPIDVPGTGGADFRARAYELSLEAPVIGAVRVVGIDGVVYARSEVASRTLPGNPDWLSIDPTRLESEGLTGAYLDNPFVRFAASTGDALPQLALLKGAQSDSTRVVGPEAIAGEPTTHYSAVLDFAQARRSAADPATARDVDRYSRALRVQTLPADVWVDAQGRLRQVRLVFSTVFGRDATASTLTFSEPGAPVGPFSAPPPGRTTDVAELARRMGG